MSTPRRTTSQPGSLELTAGTMVGEFRVVCFLGQGGMGQVYLARDTRLGRQVALKMIRPRKGKVEGRLQFLLEARTTAKFNHPNIVTVYSLGEYAGQAYFALEYLEGQTLRALIQERKLGLSDVIRIALDVSAGLVEAHRHEVLHLDLKPSNIFQCADGRVKVLDFGLARRMESAPWAEDRFGDPSSSRPGPGTPMYMAPEQWRGHACTKATDIWAFGTILFEMVAKHRPFSSHESGLQDLSSVVQSDMPLPRLVETAPFPVPADLGHLVENCLARDVGKRPSAAEVHAGLRALQSPSGKQTESKGFEEPYRGLASFRTDDAELFFGRNQEIAALQERLQYSPVVTVVGVSGAGKSSLVHAGLIPRLMEEEAWTVVSLRPGGEPFKTLAGQILRIHESTNPHRQVSQLEKLHALEIRLRNRPEALWQVLDDLGHEQKSRVLLVIDQLEEMYTQVEDRSISEAFIRGVAAAAGHPAEPHRVVLTVRSDFLSRLFQAGAIATKLTRQIMLLGAPEKEALKETLVCPAERVGYAFEDPVLVDQMVAAVEAQVAGLPLLQFAAQALWQKRDRSHRKLTRVAYEQIGGVEGAFARHAARVVETLGHEQERLVRQILLRLVTPERTRRVLLRSEVLEGLDASAEEVIERLIESRLVSATKIRKNGVSTSALELTHESLIQSWDQLRDWIDMSQEALRFRGRVQQAAQQWAQRNRSPGLLWRDEVAEEAILFFQRFREQATIDLDAISTEFLEAVVELQQRRLRRQQITRTFIGIASITVAILLTGLTVRARTEAERARTEAERARTEAERAQMESIMARNATRIAVAREHEDDPTLAFSLIREMEPDHLPPKWREVAHRARHEGIAQAVFQHPDNIGWATFSPDGARVVTVCRTKAWVWSADGTGDPRLFEGHDKDLVSAFFSPDGTKIITASLDHTARVWNVNGTGAPVILTGHKGVVALATFSSDGRRIVTASFDGTARVWNADGTGPLITLQHQQRVFSAVFSPDGTRIVTASTDGKARVWNADGSGPLFVLEGHQGAIYWASFSPNGTRIVTASADKTARVWNADGTPLPIVLEGHLDRVLMASFSPDGDHIVTASMDKMTRVWNIRRGGAPLVFKGHAAGVRTATFSPDGRSVLTGAWDTTARLWDVDNSLAPIVLRGHQDNLMGAEFSPDGARVATSSWDGTVRIWNADGTGTPIVLQDNVSYVWNLAFSPDGHRVATASVDAKARVWNADGTGSPLVFEGHLQDVTMVAFSPDGSRIVTTSKDKTARIWSVNGSEPSVILRGHDDILRFASFSPDGRRVVTASDDRTARVWNADGTGTPRVLRGHLDKVSSASFSSDGGRIVTTSVDKTVRVWPVSGRGEVVVLSGHEDTVYDAAWDRSIREPRAYRIATISSD